MNVNLAIQIHISYALSPNLDEDYNFYDELFTCIPEDNCLNPHISMSFALYKFHFELLSGGIFKTTSFVSHKASLLY